MFGKYIGELCVILVQSASNTQLFCKSGGQGQDWHTETIYDLPTEASIQV